jgi:hypothetical protein
MYDDANSIDADGSIVNLSVNKGTVAFLGASGSQPLVRDQWVELRLAIDLDAMTCDGFYNGATFGQVAFGNATQHEIAAFDIWDYALSGGVYYDNIAITPEPGTMVLLGLAGLGALARRGRRQ